MKTALRALFLSFAVALLSGDLAHADPPAASASPSAAPPLASWATAKPITFARPTSLCTGKRQGSWVRLDCAPEEWVFGFSLLGGSPDGVTLAASDHLGARAIFPVAPGDRRLFVVHRLSDHSSYSVEQQVEAVISETWIDGEEEPTISVD
jgi:hypothetical protein